MYYVYIIETELSDRYYIGYTNDYNRRWANHKCRFNSGNKTKLYSWMRKYGLEKFEMSLIDSFQTKQEACDYEVHLINKIPSELSVNLHPGGNGGYSITQAQKPEWLKKLKAARVGRKPALGMSHTEENKKKFSVFGKQRWDKYGRYPPEALDYKFSMANKLFGISKTHYYRLLKQGEINMARTKKTNTTEVVTEEQTTKNEGASTNSISPSQVVHKVNDPESDKMEVNHDSCAHENTEVRNYNKDTGVGELWCKSCGAEVQHKYKVTEVESEDDA